MAVDRYSIYRDYIEAQKEEYEKAIIEIHRIIQELRKGIVINNKIIKIKGDVKVEGRIKAFKSAFKNDRTDSKALDDCFGIRIVADNTVELFFIKEIMKRLSNPEIKRMLDIEDNVNYKIQKEKDHAERQETNYNALHQIIVRNSQNPVSPLIEVQYWDKELERRCTFGDLKHDTYKSEKYLETINGGIGRELPEYYEFDESGELVLLSKEQAIKKMFPENEDRDDGEERT